MLDSLLRPRSIAVIGASRRRESIGNAMLRHLVYSGFTGPVYPVNPAADSVSSVPAFPTVAACPTVPELAVVVVPKEQVLQVVRECAEAGVQALVVITAGFREVGGDGVEREAELLELVRGNGMRMVGPNCMGLMNTSPAVSMNATFAPAMPPSGPIAFMSQSGAMGMTILDYASEYGLGISQFVSVGPTADVSGTDLINPDFAALARSYGLHGERIERTEDFAAAFERAMASKTGALLDLVIATEALTPLLTLGQIREAVTKR